MKHIKLFENFEEWTFEKVKNMIDDIKSICFDLTDDVQYQVNMITPLNDIQVKTLYLYLKRPNEYPSLKSHSAIGLNITRNSKKSPIDLIQTVLHLKRYMELNGFKCDIINHSVGYPSIFLEFKENMVDGEEVYNIYSKSESKKGDFNDIIITSNQIKDDSY